MIAVVDAAYSGDKARVACVVIDSWESAYAHEEITLEMDNVMDYVPGKFYLRELPGIIAVVEKVTSDVKVIVIDGYVTLGEARNPGLGMKLWGHFEEKIPVIGVAKSQFMGTPKEAEVFRGNSSRPLFVTAIGIDIKSAKEHIVGMAGNYRIPDVIRSVDRLSRENN